MWGYNLRKVRGLGGWGKEGRLGREGKESFPFPFRAFFSPPVPFLICACQQASGERNPAPGLLGIHSLSWRLSYSIDNIYQMSQMWSTLADYEELAVWFNSVFLCFKKCHFLFLCLNYKTLCATVPVVPKTVLLQSAIAFPPSARASNFPWFL